MEKNNVGLVILGYPEYRFGFYPINFRDGYDFG